MTKRITLALVFAASFCPSQAQNEPKRRDLYDLIDQYSLARDKNDTVLLRSILTTDIDQLVSSGEWRNGVKAAVQGMLASTAGSPGKRTLKVDRLRMLGDGVALVDCRYEIQNADGSVRKMWSTFVAVAQEGKWKISAIRNMLPSTGR